MKKPVCTKCNRTMMNEGAAVVIEMAQKEPYKIWNCDLHRCPECGKSVLAGFAQSAIHVSEMTPVDLHYILMKNEHNRVFLELEWNCLNVSIYEALYSLKQTIKHGGKDG